MEDMKNTACFGCFLRKWLLVLLPVVAILPKGQAAAQEKTTPGDRTARPLIRVPTALRLEEARVNVKAGKRANGNNLV
jgi:hypothetical protein